MKSTKQKRYETRPTLFRFSIPFSTLGLPAILGLASFTAFASGCAHPKESTAGATDAGSASLATPAPTPSGSATVVPSAPTAPYGLALADRLRLEAAGRPTDTPTAEDVLAAIAKNGVPLEDQAQHLASPIGARFCIGAKSSQNIAMSACEYSDAAAAAAGRDASAKAFAKIEHRDIVVNKKTTLTVLQAPFNAQSQAAHDKAVATFKKL